MAVRTETEIRDQAKRLMGERSKNAGADLELDNALADALLALDWTIGIFDGDLAALLRQRAIPQAVGRRVYSPGSAKERT